MRARPKQPAPAIRAEGEILENRPLSSEAAPPASGPVPNRLLRLRVPGWPASQPGQFLMLSPGAVSSVRRDDPLLPRPMAVYRDVASAEGAEVDVLYKVEGRGTALIAAATVGERLRVVGPLGRPFPLPEERADGKNRVIIVGGGTGTASLYGLARAAAELADVTVVLGARTSGDVMARGDFEALDVKLVVTTEDGSAGEQGLATAPLERALSDGDVARVYSCGPTPMMRRCAELASSHDVHCIVSLENNMACGYGVCLGCAAPRAAGAYALVCRDGPVFDASEIQWEGLP
jgi:dihydroorotate dehydrogenase electron transfer subunit